MHSYLILNSLIHVHFDPQFQLLLLLYSQGHKYLDIDKVIVIVTVYHNILEFKLNNGYKLKLQTYNINLKIYTSKSHEMYRNIQHFLYVVTLLFKGPNVIG